MNIKNTANKKEKSGSKLLTNAGKIPQNVDTVQLGENLERQNSVKILYAKDAESLLP